MVQKLTLERHLLELNRRFYQNDLSKTRISPKTDFYSILREADSSSSPILSPAAHNVGYAFETFLATYKTAREALGRNGFLKDSEERATTKEQFIKLLSLYAGASEASSYLQARGKNRLSSRININPEGDYSLIEDLISSYMKEIKSASEMRLGIEKIESITASYLEWVANEADSKARDERFSSMRREAEELHIETGNATINGFRRAANGESRLSVPHTGFDDVVGNRELKRALKAGIENVLSYDTKARVNPVLDYGGFPQKFFIEGGEGTGKTTSIKAVIDYAQSAAEKHGIPFEVINLTNEFKSEYYSVSARNLREKLGKVFDGEKAYLIVIEDIDTLIYSRDELRDRPEDKAVLGELLNILEGIATSNLGNYMIISTTNRPLSQDTALIQRLREKTLAATGPESIDDYKCLFRMKFGNALGSYVILSDPELAGIAERCMEYGFSGRSVRNVVTDIVDRCMTEKPGNWLSLSADEKKALMPELYRKASADEVMAGVDSYALFMIRSQEQERRHRIEEMKEMMIERRAAEKEMQEVGA